MPHDERTYNEKGYVPVNLVTNAVIFFLISIAIGTYCIILYITLKRGYLHQQIKWRANAILILSIFIFIFYILRTIWNITAAFGVNNIKKSWSKNYTECIENESNWYIFIIFMYVSIFYLFVFIIVVLVLVSLS